MSAAAEPRAPAGHARLPSLPRAILAEYKNPDWARRRRRTRLDRGEGATSHAQRAPPLASAHRILIAFARTPLVKERGVAEPGLSAAAAPVSVAGRAPWAIPTRVRFAVLRVQQHHSVDSRIPRREICANISVQVLRDTEDGVHRKVMTRRITKSGIKQTPIRAIIRPRRFRGCRLLLW